MVLIVSRLLVPVDEGVRKAGLNEHEASSGREEATQDKYTSWDVLPVNVELIVSVLALPCWMVMLPDEDKEKSKVGGGGVAIWTFTTMPGYVPVPK